MIRIVLADDHLLLLDALESVLGEECDLELVARCVDGPSATRAIHALRPDVVVSGTVLAGYGGMEVLREIRKQELSTAVVLLASQISEDETFEALRLGVSGILLKSMPARLLIECIRKVHSGGRWLEKNAIHRALQQILKIEKGVSEHSGVLSTRERDVIREVARGLRNRQVAERLFISESTVKVHLNNIFEKLNVRSRVELSLYAQQKGLV